MRAAISGSNSVERWSWPGNVPVTRHPAGQAYVYGLLMGPVAIPCAGPFLVAPLAISVGIVDASGRVGSFVAERLIPGR
jgi:cytochrome c biogenesis protein CcdA